MRMLHNGSASAFQAEGASSILVIRSTLSWCNGSTEAFEAFSFSSSLDERASPCSPAVEATDLKFVQRGFESHFGYSIIK